MILDEQSIFSNKQIISESCVSENILDLGRREVSFGTPIELFIQIADTFQNIKSLTVAVQTAEDEDFSSAVTLIEQTMNSSDLVKGAVSSVKFLPKGNLGFMRLSYTVAKEGSDSDAVTGAITAALADGTQASFHNI